MEVASRSGGLCVGEDSRIHGGINCVRRRFSQALPSTVAVKILTFTKFLLFYNFFVVFAFYCLKVGFRVVDMTFLFIYAYLLIWGSIYAYLLKLIFILFIYGK